MNVVVCIKQVPETGAIKLTGPVQTLKREGVNMIVNPFDQYAIEEAIRIKERDGGTITAVCMGEAKGKEAVREAIAMGADAGMLLADPAFTDSDTLGTARVLAQGLKRLEGATLIILGRQAVDGASGQVGPQLAEELGVPHLTNVRKILELRPDYLKVERLLEVGVEVAETSLPALITVVKEINEPRLPSLKGIMRAKKTEITTYGAADLGVDASQVGAAGAMMQVVEYAPPPARGKGELIQGEVQEQVHTLVAKLRGTKLI